MSEEELFKKYKVRQPIEKNGQSECIICKEKHRYSLTWTSFLYEYENHYYCKEDLLIILLNKELQQKENIIKEVRDYIRNNMIMYDNIEAEVEDLLILLDKGE